MVDGKSLVGLTHDEAVAVLKTTQKLVQLVVATEHLDGDSLNSSLQSIPENMANIINTVDRQGILEPVIVPEDLHSPLRSAFQKVNLEMNSIINDNTSFAEDLPSGQMETSFQEDSLKTAKVRRSEGQPLGFSIRQGYSKWPGKRAIFIQAIDPHGAVGRSKQLQEGDQLLKVNETSLEDITREEALGVLTVS